MLCQFQNLTMPFLADFIKITHLKIHLIDSNVSNFLNYKKVLNQSTLLSPHTSVKLFSFINHFKRNFERHMTLQANVLSRLRQFCTLREF